MKTMNQKKRLDYYLQNSEAKGEIHDSVLGENEIEYSSIKSKELCEYCDVPLWIWREGKRCWECQKDIHTWPIAH